MNVDLQCKPSTAIVTWEQRDDVLYYLVSGTLSTGEADTICNSTTDSCEMSGLQCGVEYAFTVTSYSSLCHSDVSTTVHITTGRLFSPSNLIYIYIYIYIYILGVSPTKDFHNRIGILESCDSYIQHYHNWLYINLLGESRQFYAKSDI